MAEIRFYVDADLLALAKSLVQARYDVTYPGDSGDQNRGRTSCPIKRADTKDLAWIPTVAAQGWVAISRDRTISRKPAEVQAVKQHALRMVVLDVRRDATTWGELGIVVARWTDIERVASLKGPRVFLASRTTFRELAL
jgi:hypothetical protein